MPGPPFLCKGSNYWYLAYSPSVIRTETRWNSNSLIPSSFINWNTSTDIKSNSVSMAIWSVLLLEGKCCILS